MPSPPSLFVALSSFSAMPFSFSAINTAWLWSSLNAIHRQRSLTSSLLLLLCCCYCLLLCACASDATPLHASAGLSGEQFERADRDYRPLQFGKRESYRPLQFGKRTAARGPFAPAGVAPFAYGAALLHNTHNGGLEEVDPTMDQYVLVMERRK